MLQGGFPGAKVICHESSFQEGSQVGPAIEEPDSSLVTLRDEQDFPAYKLLKIKAPFITGVAMAYPSTCLGICLHSNPGSRLLTTTTIQAAVDEGIS